MARPTDRQPLTVEQAKQLTRGTVLNVYDLHGKDLIRNADGTPARYKVTSVKQWKREPNRVVVRVKFGLSSYFMLHEHMFQPPEGSGDGLGYVYKQ